MLVPIPEEAEIVRLIFEWRRQGQSLRKIANTLCEMEVRSPRGHSNWSIETIRKILHNEKYYGDVLLQKTYISEPTTPKGYIAYATGTWKKVTLDSANVHALVFDDKLVECREMTVVMEVEMKKGAKCKNWQLWGRVNGKFKKIGRIELPGGDGDTSKTFIYDDPITIDAVALTPTVSGGYSWSMALGVVDIWTNG